MNNEKTFGLLCNINPLHVSEYWITTSSQMMKRFEATGMKECQMTANLQRQQQRQQRQQWQSYDAAGVQN